MLFFAVLLFGVLALGPQAVLSSNLKFKLSEVKQCEPVSITFDGNANAIPMSLTLVPFNSSPIFIPIPHAAVDTPGVYVTFVPLAAGTTFVASLGDASGENVAQVSDIIQVLPSSTGNSTCLPATQDTATTRRFTVNNSTFSQCETFTLNYDRSIISRAPTVRYYNPKGPSRLLNLTTDEPATGSAAYLLSFDRSKEVVLVFDDGSTNAESSPLITIGGDSASSTECLDANKDEAEFSDNTPQISQGVIIGSAVGGGVVVLVSVLITLFILRERRRQREQRRQFPPSLIEKGHPSTSPSVPLPVSTTVWNDAINLSPGVVKDPPYTAEKFLSPTTTVYSRSSMASWAQPTPEDQRFPGRTPNNTYSPREPAGERHSLHSLDIEGILNMATVQVDRSSGQTTGHEPLGPTLQSSEPSVAPQLVIPDPPFPARGHLRDPSNISGTSMASAITLSSVVDPFTDNATKQPGLRSPLDPPIRAPPSVVIGLPSSPRHGPHFSRHRNSDIGGMQRSSNRSTKGSKGDYYGFDR